MKYILFVSILSPLLFSASLDEVISYALKNSTIIKQIKAQQELSKLKLKASKASRFGEFDVVGSATHYNIERTLAPITPASMKSPTPITTSNDIYSAGITYNIPLFTGFAQTRDVEINDLALKMSDIKERLTKEQLIYNIRSLYLTALTLIKIKEAQHSYTKSLKRLSKNIAYEVELGKKAKIDLIKSESDIALSNAKEKMLEANIKTIKATISSLSNYKVDRFQDIDISIKRPNYTLEELLKDDSSLAKVEMEDLAIKKADKMIEKSSSQNLPQLHLNSYYGKNFGEDKISDDFDDKEIWQVGVNLKYNLLDFGKRSSTIQQAKVAKLKAKLDKEQTLLDLKKQVIEAIGKIEQNYAQYLGNKEAHRLSKKAEKIERVRYKNGVSTLNDYLLAKSKSQLALAKLIESRYEYQKSIYNLDYILERGRESEN